MRDQSVTTEARQALFRAVVAATEAGGQQASVKDVACAMLLSDDVRSALHGAGVQPQEVVDGIHPSFREALRSAEQSVSKAGYTFGSSAHIASLPYRSWPLDPAVISALRARSKDVVDARLTPLQILAALASSDAELSTAFVSAGLSHQVLRSDVTEDR